MTKLTPAEREAAIALRLARYRHNALIGQVRMAMMCLASVESAPTATPLAKKIAFTAREILVPLDRALRAERVENGVTVPGKKTP